MTRKRELDFLRGAAIILVLFRHQYVFSFTNNIGWIGVDLFFVLSGFLVSGLLFKEYLKTGEVKPRRFLIRRGFKIYPMYYLFYLVYLVPILFFGHLNIPLFLADMTFTQNYVHGWGYAYAPSWSLAVEEHFYFGFSLLLWFCLKHNKIVLQKSVDVKNKMSSFEKLIISMLVLCLALRYISNIFFAGQFYRNNTMSHLRIDSLLIGVLISYYYYFKINYLKHLFESRKKIFLIMAILCLSWTPFFDPTFLFFAKTIGFTLVYISFAIVLTYFLLTADINKKLDSVFTAPMVNFISKVGVCSYSIYIIHTFVNIWTEQIVLRNNLYTNHYISFLLTSVASVLIGMLMTAKAEHYFLKVRDKYYPGNA